MLSYVEWSGGPAVGRLQRVFCRPPGSASVLDSVVARWWPQLARQAPRPRSPPPRPQHPPRRAPSGCGRDIGRTPTPPHCGPSCVSLAAAAWHSGRATTGCTLGIARSPNRRSRRSFHTGRFDEGLGSFRHLRLVVGAERGKPVYHAPLAKTRLDRCPACSFVVWSRHLMRSLESLSSALAALPGA